MLFQTQEFCLVFLPLSLLAYYALSRSAAARQFVLIFASLVFYGWWDARFIPLLLAQISLTWALARLAASRNGNWPLTLGICLNLASLGSFKYLDFFITGLESALAVSLPRSGLVLPIGISFFSFQLISYLIDRRRADAPLYRPGEFALFVLLYPHLIAGPIVRHNELVPQFALDPRREGMWQRFGCGLALLTIGIAKKLIVADKLASVADRIFARAGELSMLEAWQGALAFSLQLFLDFSAYTEMAIGIALLYGLVLPENFRRPYLACDLRQFWRRWHMSLSAFLRDYLFIPLGGSRNGKARFVMATLVTMGLCGLWHGAGWTYVAWGLMHGAGLVLCRLWQQAGFRLPRSLGWLLTMLFVITGWVIFRAPDFATAAQILAAMAGIAAPAAAIPDFRLILAGAALSFMLPPAHDLKDRFLAPRPWLAAALAVLAVYCIAEAGREAPQPFIYFRF